MVPPIKLSMNQDLKQPGLFNFVLELIIYFIHVVVKGGKTGLLIFRGKKCKISGDFQGQIRGKIGRFRGNFTGKKSKFAEKSADFAGF